MGALDRIDPPAPSPEMLTAVRRHVTSRYARGVDNLLWELEKRPMRDADAVRAVMSAYGSGNPVDALDFGAALVIVQAMRLELDLLEADVLDAAEGSRMSRESVAAVLELPGAAAVESRHELLRARRSLAGALTSPDPQARRPAAENRDAARRAGQRARRASERATEAGRRREQLVAPRGDQDDPAVPARAAERAEQAAAHASEARVSLREAAERVALCLLRAADALELCAARGAAGDEQERAEHRRQAAQYLEDAAGYRELAARYRDAER